jgi:hypothetical protein
MQDAARLNMLMEFPAPDGSEQELPQTKYSGTLEAKGDRTRDQVGNRSEIKPGKYTRFREPELQHQLFNSDTLRAATEFSDRRHTAV